jgi:hypothetical protein
VNTILKFPILKISHFAEPVLEK